jgi:hypothetical protein
MNPGGDDGRMNLGAIGYLFDPIPRKAEAAVMSGALRPFDLWLLIRLIRLRGPLADSCWTTIPHLCKQLGQSKQTILRSLKRLIKARLIRRERVPRPDPLEPRNRTGYRIIFLFMVETAAEESGCNPATQTAGARELGANPDTQTAGAPARKPDLVPGEFQTWNKVGTQSGTQIKTELKEIETNVSARRARGRTDRSGSVVCARASDSSPNQDTDADPARLDNLADFAEGRFNESRGRVADAVAAYTLEWVECAVYGVPKLRNWGGVLTALANWKREGSPSHSARVLART